MLDMTCQCECRITLTFWCGSSISCAHVIVLEFRENVKCCLYWPILVVPKHLSFGPLNGAFYHTLKLKKGRVVAITQSLNEVLLEFLLPKQKTPKSLLRSHRDNDLHHLLWDPNTWEASVPPTRPTRFRSEPQQQMEAIDFCDFCNTWKLYAHLKIEKRKFKFVALYR